MLIYDANDTWDNYRGYIVNLYWNDWITAEDYDLSLEHGRLYKDGKPYTKGTDDPRISTTHLPWTATKFPTASIMNLINNYQKSNTMESVKVTPPEGYEIDPASTTSEIFFRKKDKRPSQWIDLFGCEGWRISPNIYDDNIPSFAPTKYDVSIRKHHITKDTGKELWPTKELAEAALALSELMQYRQRWIGDWKPDWNEGSDKYTIARNKDMIHGDINMSEYKIMSFPTREMRVDFVNTFKDLLETAKPLL